MDITNLWGEEFVINTTKTPVVKKTKTTKDIPLDKLLASNKLTLEERLNIINDNVTKILSKQINNVLVIRDIESFKSYIDKAIEQGEIAIDTETSNSLDYLNCKLMGLCLYTDNNKQVYIPINHINNITNELLDNQLTEQDCKEQLQRLIDANTKIIFHNYKFDYQVIKCTCGIELPAYWDTMVATRMIDEREEAGLKKQYIIKIDPEQQKYDIEHLFKNVKYAQVDPNIFALYAATDAMMTYKLYKYQQNLFNIDRSLDGMYNIFRTIEMPIIKVVADMEIRGININQEYAKRLSAKYHKIQDDINKQIQEELSQYTSKITSWKLSKEAQILDGKKTKADQLSDPINLDSPKQLAILIFDILKFPEGLGKTVYDTPRGTGSNILELLAKDYNFKLGDLLSKKKGIDKLVSTFVDALPVQVNPKDHKIHTQFNPLGAIARFSSNKPNMQQLPSGIKDIRPMFCVDEGCALIGADLSGAELRAAVNSCRDEALVDCYNSGRDLYSLVGSVAYNCSYTDACEFYPEGTEIEFQGQKVITGYKTHTNYIGKKHRNAAKKIAIGLVYGRGAYSIAEQIGEPLEKGKEILETVNKGFPGLKTWMDKVREDTLKLGYVDDCLGRRRHLPNALLPKYSFEPIKSTTINPFLVCDNNYIDPNLKANYLKQLEKANYKEINNIINQAAKENIKITNNQAKIAEALREAPNWCCQAQTASWIKLNMIAIDKDPVLKDLGFELLLTIHDEVQGQCPIKNAEKAKERLEYLMSNTCKDLLCIPLPSDGTIEYSGAWYASELETLLNQHYNTYTLEQGMSSEEALNKLYKEEPELLPENIYDFLINRNYLKI